MENNKDCKCNEDKLMQIFELQQKLQERLFSEKFGKDFNKLDPKEIAEHIKDNVYFVTEELHEMTRELPYVKNWKTYKMTPVMLHDSVTKARAELIDALHFFINCALLLGMTPNMILSMYIDKNDENHARQNRGY